MHATITPYLFFHGRCLEALDFYRDGLGAEIGPVMLFSQSPEPIPEGFLEPGFENKVMHGSFSIEGARVHVADGDSSDGDFSGFRLTLTPSSAEKGSGYFDALAQGGTVEMPLGPTFFSPLFGMVTDKFGVGWMILVQEPSEPG